MVGLGVVLVVLAATLLSIVGGEETSSATVGSFVDDDARAEAAELARQAAEELADEERRRNALSPAERAAQDALRADVARAVQARMRQAMVDGERIDGGFRGTGTGWFFLQVQPNYPVANAFILDAEDLYPTDVDEAAAFDVFVQECDGRWWLLTSSGEEPVGGEAAELASWEDAGCREVGAPLAQPWFVLAVGDAP